MGPSRRPLPKFRLNMEEVRFILGEGPFLDPPFYYNIRSTTIASVLVWKTTLPSDYV